MTLERPAADPPADGSDPWPDGDAQDPRGRRPGRGKLVVVALALCAVGGAVALLRSIASAVLHPEAAAPAPVPVVTAPVRKQDVPITLTGVGTVNALNVATIRSQVTGYLQSADFKEGQFVRRGDVLARIDPRIYQARLEQAQAQLAKDQALLANQKTNLARNEPLLQKGFATDQQVVSERAQIAQTESALKGDQAAIDYAQTELDFATLRAPFDGVTGIRRVDIGNIINPDRPRRHRRPDPGPADQRALHAADERHRGRAGRPDARPGRRDRL